MADGGGYQITPLGAAVVEAMPSRRRVRAIQKRFRERGVCPVSRAFPMPGDVEEFYRERGERVRGLWPVKGGRRG